ncbi:MAG: nitrate reductase cytochrome c-type subunit [Gallionellaceae bacterium]|nr:nitrate reductase cytochrome c-type subunit [Gallionellaceae bacterium]
MRKSTLFGAVLAAMTFSLSASAVQDQSIPDDDLGLSKSSVYDTPSPAAFEYGNKDAGSVGKRVVRSYMTAPPMIPHTVKDMLPITRDSNLCKDCHVQPDLIGMAITPGLPVPAPASHYVDVKKGELYMGRWNCTQCHRPQANVKLLVDSVFGNKAGKK